MNQPDDILTTSGLAIATICALVASVSAVVRIRSGSHAVRLTERATAIAATAICTALFLYRFFGIHHDWVPLESHVDGLLLLNALLGLIIGYTHWSRRLRGMDVFVLPVLTLMILWALCASWWTFRPFAIESVWNTVHLLSVYVGTLAIGFSAAFGGMYLFIQRQLRSKEHPAVSFRLIGRFASLEAVERGNTVAATIAFAFISVGLITGIVIMTGSRTDAALINASSPRMWKIILAAATWLILAPIMHIQLAPSFRGKRMAILSIVCFVLVMTVLAIALIGGSMDSATTFVPWLLTQSAGGAACG